MSNDGTATDISVDEFLRNLDESGLSAIEEGRSAAGNVAAPSGSTIAARLVSSGVLTAFQAKAVLQRRFADLRMGNYDILDKLGVGGMGTVFKARHRRMKRLVALKVLTTAAAQSAAFTQRFQREVETIAKLHHPNVVMAFDADEAELGPFLIMEFVDGRDLAIDVERGGPLAVADAVDCIVQAARGLECAHGLGIVHRDIKPSNLLRDTHGVVKVADLGLARLNGPSGDSAENSSLTQAGSVLGTIDYMAPEQAVDSASVDARVDIYSLGCTLYFLLAGRAPFQAGSIMALLLKHREAEIPSLMAIRPDVPPELDKAYRRMVAKKPQDRFSTMHELIVALEELRQSSKLSELRPHSDSPAEDAQPDRTVALSPGQSTTTGFSSAAQSPTAVIEPATAQDAVSLKHRIVVLVEPSRTQAGIIRRYLEQLGIAVVHFAKAGQEALELAQKEHANVIVSSMHLSDMTGVELAHKLLEAPACNGIGFVLATSESETQQTATIPNNPRFALMPKPFDHQRLSLAITAVLKHSDELPNR